MPELRSLHEERASTSPDFIYLEGQIERTRTLRERAKLSLNEATVKQEREENRREEFDAENMRRALKGLALKEWVDEEEFEEDSNPSQNDDAATAESTENQPEEDEEEDPLILESGRILADFISLSQRGISALNSIPVPQ